MPRNPFGVGYAADPARRRLVLRAATLFDLQVTTRKCVREVFIDDCERRRYVMLHASAVASPPTAQGRRRVVLFVGEKRAGKTTLALRCVFDRGWQLLSNDHLILIANPRADLGAASGPTGPVAAEARLVVTSLPTLIPVKVGTLTDLLDRYGDRLPEPWDTQGAAIGEYRAMPARQRSALMSACWSPTRQLAQDNPAATPLDGAPRWRWCCRLRQPGRSLAAPSGSAIRKGRCDHTCAAIGWPTRD